MSKTKSKKTKVRSVSIDNHFNMQRNLAISNNDIVSLKTRSLVKNNNKINIMKLLGFNEIKFSKYETRANNIKHGLDNYFDDKKRESLAKPPIYLVATPSHTRQKSLTGICIENKGRKALDNSLDDDEDLK